MARLDIREVDTGGRRSMRFEAYREGESKPAGYIKAYRMNRKVRGKTVWTIDSVKAFQERQGVGTALYEAVAQAVCKKRNRLVSYGPRTAKSEGFWRKQERKGRVTRIRQTETKHAAFMLDCDHAADLGEDPGMIRTMPWWAAAGAAVAFVALVGRSSSGGV